MLLLERKAMTNLNSVLKSIDITLPMNVCLVKAMVFPVVMYGCESRIIKKVECWRTDAFDLWCWRRHLRVPWTARRSNQSILKEINPEIFIGRTGTKPETPILCLPDAKRWLIGNDSLKSSSYKEDEMNRESGWEWKTREPGVLRSMGSQGYGHNLATEQWQLLVVALS